MLRVGVDVGGTFTDLVALDEHGRLVALKVASTPSEPQQGVLHALDALLEAGRTHQSITFFAHSTTIAVNALLGQLNLELPRIVFVTTEGFRDVIEIGRQNRSSLYDLFITRPHPLVAREDRVVVRERMLYDGKPLVALDDAEVLRVVSEVRARDPEVVAIGLLHAYANDAHERKIADALTAAFPNVPVTRSSDVNPEYREYERFSTTLVNAALLPIVRRYLDQLTGALRERRIAAPLLVMRSDGGMTDATHANTQPAALIESGPAAGVIAAAALSRELGASDVLSFDMGGTTAKAGTIVDARAQVAHEFEVAGTMRSGRAVKGSGYPVRFSFVDLAEISAGGGTIAWIDDGDALRVGPLSAGADPGPACYGRSELPTVTDANVVLGRTNPNHLLGGTFRIDARRSHSAIATLAERLEMSSEAVAAGIIALVDASMANVLRVVTVERGLDPRDFAMIAFGGNGPLHACALAAELGIKRIVVPQHPGVFSAIGLLAARLQTTAVESLLRSRDAMRDDELTVIFARLAARAKAVLREQGAETNSIDCVHECDMRYRGQSFDLPVPYKRSAVALEEMFHVAHERRYGYAVRGEPVEIVNARVTASAGLNGSGIPHALRNDAEPSAPPEERSVWIDGRYRRVPVYQRDALGTAKLRGPAIIEEYDAGTFVGAGWRVRAHPGRLELER